MRISQNGLNLIKKWEGCYLTSYKDPVGIWTIGYGTTNSDKAITGTEIKQGMSISQETANNWLEASVNRKYVPLVEKYQSKYNFNQNQFDALVSFAYNIGSIDQLTANGTRSISEIAAHITAYCNAGGKRLQGLVNRRNEELALFNTPCKEPQVTKSIVDLANEVIAGKWGSGEARKQALGSLYNEVQAKVNEILKPKNQVQYYPACNSKYVSIVDALNSIGVDSSFNNRKKLSQKNNVHDYTGTAAQNNQLLAKLKAGRLIKI